MIDKFPNRHNGLSLGSHSWSRLILSNAPSRRWGKHNKDRFTAVRDSGPRPERITHAEWNSGEECLKLAESAS